MNDLETLKSMLTKAGIEFSVECCLFQGELIKHTISVERGYLGFITEFAFDENGSLKDIGAYE